METRVDELARALARATSRREALRALGSGIAGLLGAVLGVGVAAPAEAGWGRGRPRGPRCYSYRCAARHGPPANRTVCRADGTACASRFSGRGYSCTLTSQPVVRDCSVCG